MQSHLHQASIIILLGFLYFKELFVLYIVTSHFKDRTQTINGQIKINKLVTTTKLKVNDMKTEACLCYRKDHAP